jgi:hypothetical protein
MSAHLVFDLVAKAASAGVTWTRHRWRLHETLRETMARAGPGHAATLEPGPFSGQSCAKPCTGSGSL